MAKFESPELRPVTDPEAIRHLGEMMGLRVEEEPDADGPSVTLRMYRKDGTLALTAHGRKP